MSISQLAYYYALRTIARTEVADSINERVRKYGGTNHSGGLTLCSINKEAIDFARKEWPKYYGDKTHNGFEYSWETLYRKFTARPSFFDLAIWQQVNGERVLQGLALGKPSNGKTHLTLNWIERSFAPTYLRGGALLPILACAEEYAKLLGCHRVLIKDAVDPQKYERYGYTSFKLPKVTGSYLYKEISNDHGQQQ
ncbi:MAG TPA: hypothetical protein VIF34_03605 [Methylocystis sp.]|jgi:hypothetical protein